MRNTPPLHRLCGTAPETKIVTLRSPQVVIYLYWQHLIFLLIDNTDIFIVVEKF